MLIYSRKMNKLSDKRLNARLEDSDDRNESSSKNQQVLLNEIKDKLNENDKQIQLGNNATFKILTTLRVGWFRQLGQELKSIMQKIFIVNLATYKTMLDMRGALPSHLERSLYQEPFILEDGIGRIAPVHMQFINSWDAFDSVLESRFRNMQGHLMVQNKEYVIEESATRRDIDRSRPWEASFLPGQKCVMSMLFNEPVNSTSSCPRCQLPSDRSQDSDVQW